MNDNKKVTKEIAEKVLSVVDKGLSSGLGKPVPGSMCVEAAVCYAYGLPHGDDPPCVSRAVRALKIQLNDIIWSSKTARAKGMRRLAIAQLGSADVIDDRVFSKKVAEYTISVTLPRALRIAASLQKDQHHKSALEDAANRCEKEKSEAAAEAAARASSEAARAAARAAWSAARAAWSAAEAAAEAAWSAAWSAARAVRTAAWVAARVAEAAEADKELSDFAEGIVQILIEMKSPGCEYLYLTKE